MTTELFGVYMDNTVTPWAAIVGKEVRAYATTAGTFEGRDDTDSNGRFVLTGLSDRDDWVPVASTSGGVVILEAIATADVLTMLTDQTVSVAQLNADGQVSVDGETMNVIDDFDVVVDANYAGSSPSVFNDIKAGIDFGGISIWLKLADDTSSITIASGDKVQRIQGKDADTTTVPVDITCNKAQVTFEQLNFATKTLSLDANTATVNAVKISGTGKLDLKNSRHSIFELRAEGVTSGVPVEFSNVAARCILISCRFNNNTGTGDILFALGSSSVARIDIAHCAFIYGTAASDYTIRSTQTTGVLDDLTLVGNKVVFGTNGGIQLTVRGAQITNNLIQAAETLASGKRGLVISSPSGDNIESTVANNTFRGTDAADVMFECASADADAAGLVLGFNQFLGVGTILGSQDALWIGNNMAGRTVNFQSKTGIVVLGGDMTGATLQNIPADIVFRNVKGQDDRGDYIPVDGTVDLGSDAKRFQDLFLGGNADIEGNLQLDGNATIDGTLASGAQTVAGHLLPSADDTYDLGSPTKQFRDGNFDGTVRVDKLEVSLVANEGLVSNLLPDTDSIRVLGSSSRRFVNLFSDALDVAGNIVVSGTVDTVDIAARDHGGATSVQFNDSVPVNLGTGSDATFIYDGTDMIINPKAVGSGLLQLLGDLLLKDAVPTLTFEDTDQTTPLGKFLISSLSDLLVIQGRNAGDTAYENIMILQRVADGGAVFFDNAINVDVINERDSAAGVTIDGVPIKDGNVDGVTVDTHAHDGSSTGAPAVAATNVTYAPAVLADWDASADPGDTDDALDQLAARVTALEP